MSMVTCWPPSVTASRCSQHAANKDGDRSRARAHVDDDDAHFGFVRFEHGKRRRIWRGGHRLDGEMAALHREDEIARRSLIAGRDVKIDAQFFADHVFGIANASDAVERKAHRQRMHHHAAAMQRMSGGSLQHAVNVGLGHGAAADRRLRREVLRRQASAGRCDDDAVDGRAGHAFGGVDRLANGAFRLIHVDDLTILHAARTLMADAKNARAMRAPWERRAVRFGRQSCDEAGDLGRADVQHRKRRGAAWRQLLHTRRNQMVLHM